MSLQFGDPGTAGKVRRRRTRVKGEPVYGANVGMPSAGMMPMPRAEDPPEDTGAGAQESTPWRFELTLDTRT